MKQIIFLFLSVALTGCVYPNMTTPSSQIAPAYISSAKYDSFDCGRLRAEFDSVNRRESVLVVAQEQRFKNSQQQAMWWGYGQGDGVEAAELAHVKGEKEAIRKALEVKQCGI